MVKVFAGIGFARLLALFFVFLLFASCALAFWPFSGLVSSWETIPAVREKVQETTLAGLEKKFGVETISFVKKINLRLEAGFSPETMEGIALIARRFPEKNGKAVLDALTDKVVGGPIWSAGDLKEMAETENGQLTRFFFKKSPFTKTGTTYLDAIAMPYYKDFFIETTALNSRLSKPKTLYYKITGESKKFRGIYSDATLVIVLKKGSSLTKKETEKTIRDAFENSANLEMQNITRIAIYDAQKQKTITIYSRQDWINRKP
ncbi:MAG: hypothetical protein WC634_05620 [archaeon]